MDMEISGLSANELKIRRRFREDQRRRQKGNKGDKGRGREIKREAEKRRKRGKENIDRKRSNSALCLT
jgi:hypothetical protein